MSLKVLRGRSLKTRVTLFTLGIFVVTIWSLALIAGRMLREDMVSFLGEQQYSTVKFMAAEVARQVDDRFKALETVAGTIKPETLASPQAVQKQLEEGRVFQALFNAGSYVTGMDGRAVASLPVEAQRIGVTYMDRDYIQIPLGQGSPAIGQPVMGRQVKAPIFGMSAPIRDANNKVIGALAGVVDLSRANFLDSISQGKYGKTGDYFIVNVASRVIVTSSDKRRLMEVLPAPGVSPWIDRFMQGYEGSAVVVNPLGVEVLVSVKQVPLAGWYLSAILPTAEAFALVNDLRRRLVVVALVLTLLAGLLTWWMLSRQLTPLADATKVLAALTTADQVPPPLAVTRDDEVGRLIGGFNRLLETLRHRDEALKATAARLRSLTEMSSDFFWETDAEHRLSMRTESRREVAESVFVQYPSVGQRRWEIPSLSPNEAGWQAFRETVDAHLPFRNFEIARPRANGMVHHISISGDPVFDAQGRFTGYLGIGSDITAQKRAEEAQRIAATAFETEHGMLIADANWEILRVNRAFTDITGYAAQEVVGQLPLVLRSGRHDAEFFDIMSRQLEQTGAWEGEIWDRRKNGEVFPVWLSIAVVKDEHGAVTHYVEAFSDITARKAAEEQIQSLAFFDPLTGLPNRRLLMDRLKQALATHSRHARKGALLFVDLDNFKMLNDTLGHDMGDLLLQQIAKSLTTCVREGDTVARLGGDEFVVMLEDLSESALEAATQAEIVGEKILLALNRSYALGRFEHHSTPSIGITLFGETPEPLEEPLKRADLAMYQAKAAGRNTMRFFDPQMQAVVTARAALQVNLAEALDKDQFRLNYQAQMGRAQGGEAQLTGAEVLLRWQHPERGMVPPSDFIALAEETGLILSIGQWVLEKACTQLAQWESLGDGSALSRITLSVNVSPRQVHQENFVAEVLDVLARTGARPERLKLELTESLLVTNVEEVIAKMNALKARGVGFSLDDFGTGYSSLSHLKRLPLDQLKIDQSFVRDILVDPNDAAIAKMVIALGESLGLAVIAEGVETAEQQAFLASQGCHAYQGYLYSRPLPLAEFEAFARKA